MGEGKPEVDKAAIRNRRWASLAAAERLVAAALRDVVAAVEGGWDSDTLRPKLESLRASVLVLRHGTWTLCLVQTVQSLGPSVWGCGSDSVLGESSACGLPRDKLYAYFFLCCDRASPRLPQGNHERNVGRLLRRLDCGLQRLCYLSKRHLCCRVYAGHFVETE
jgi:hypothetical protein